MNRFTFYCGWLLGGGLMLLLVSRGSTIEGALIALLVGAVSGLLTWLALDSLKR